jgi:hypothetical protein
VLQLTAAEVPVWARQLGYFLAVLLALIQPTYRHMGFSVTTIMHTLNACMPKVIAFLYLGILNNNPHTAHRQPALEVTLHHPRHLDIFHQTGLDNYMKTQ